MTGRNEILIYCVLLELHRAHKTRVLTGKRNSIAVPEILYLIKAAAKLKIGNIKL